MTTERDEEAHPTKVTRRSLLGWLGKSAVIGLGAEVVAACASRTTTPRDASASEGEDPEADVAADVPGEEAPPPDGFPFAPGSGTGEVFAGWPERTVDRQELEEILASWTLTVDGLVEEPVTLPFGDLVELARQDQVTDFHCVEGWSIWDVPWNGVHLSTLFEMVRPLPTATHVTLHTFGDRYDESVPLPVALEPRTLLAYGIAGSTIPLKHGFPLRLVVPRLWAYKSPKFVYRVELADGPVEGFWVAAGYPYDGEVPADRLREGKY